MKEYFCKAKVFLGGIFGIIFILYTFLAFTVDAIVKFHYSAPLFLIFLAWLLFIALLISPIIMKSVGKITIVNDLSVQARKKRLFAIFAGGASLILLLCSYLASYPGPFSIDSLDQLEQAMSGSYDDWHPAIHTLLFFKLPLLLTGNWQGSIVLFQLICFSAMLWYLFDTILHYTNIRYALLSVIFILLNPDVCRIVMYPWKDIAFAMGAVLLVSYMLRIFFTKGEWLKKISNIIAFVIVAAITTIIRHNALLFTVPLILCIFLFTMRKRAVLICLGIISLIVGIKIPLYSALGVESPGQRQVEKLGLPLTVIGAVVTNAPETLDDETLEFAYKVSPKEVWEEEYIRGSYNSVKWNEKTDNNVIEEYGAKKVIIMMFKCFKASPKYALRGLFSLVRPLFSLADDSFVLMKISIGLVHFALLALALAKSKINKKFDWKRILLLLPVFCYNFGTSLLLTGYEDCQRFFFYIFLLVPLYVVLFCRKDDMENSKNDVC